MIQKAERESGSKHCRWRRNRTIEGEDSHRLLLFPSDSLARERGGGRIIILYQRHEIALRFVNVVVDSEQIAGVSLLHSARL
jgi:hypothetical protein